MVTKQHFELKRGPGRTQASARVIVKPRSVDLAFEIRGLSSDRALGSEVERRNSTGALSGACHCRSASPTMPRQARVATVGAPHHITRRGNNRQDVFLLDPDRGPCLRASAIACRHPRSPARQGEAVWPPKPPASQLNHAVSLAPRNQTQSNHRQPTNSPALSKTTGSTASLRRRRTPLRHRDSLPAPAT